MDWSVNLVVPHRCFFFFSQLHNESVTAFPPLSFRLSKKKKKLHLELRCTASALPRGQRQIHIIITTTTIIIINLRGQTHMTKMGKAAAQLQGKPQVPTWRRNVLRQLLLVVWTLCTDHDERSEEGNKQIIHAQKNGIASELEEGTGHTTSWSSLQSLEVRAGSGSMSWR